ncbi:disulfide bond formation protein DsbA [Candidatus Parcubacteria bacterium]|nr:disulfide bond formation protein DsbA [Candidatus Parcubacteria bacterium]
MEKSSLTIPLAIIIAGAIIAGALVYSNKNKTVATTTDLTSKKEAIDIKIRPIDMSDHILGNPDSKVLLVEYSDTQCPFCKIFHVTLNKLASEYGKDGNFTWVYRHFPLDSLHKKARKEAEAFECAADLGGNSKFWEYTNKLYETTKSNDNLDPAELPKIAAAVGLDVKAFNTCLASGKFATAVDEDTKEAQQNGGTGTPYSIFILKSDPSKELRDFLESNNAQIMKSYPGSDDFIGISKDNRKIFVSGAMPYEMMKAIVDLILK